MRYENCSLTHLEEALKLASTEYCEECKRNPQLPDMDSHIENKLHRELSELFQQKYGKMAFMDGKLVGYLAFTAPFEGAFGNVTGVFSPFGGNAYTGDDRGKLASLLLEEVSREMILDHIGHIAVCRPAGDEEVGRSFVMNSFGIRCSDSIIRLSERRSRINGIDDSEVCKPPFTTGLDSAFTFCELSHTEKYQIRHLQEKLNLHLCDAPVFFPPWIEHLDHWFANESIRVFAAKKDGRAVGFLSITDEGETYLTRDASNTNMSGAYVEPEFRQYGIARQLLEYLSRICISEGFPYLGVDCETMNPTALRFWGKYFNNYTYSYVRRIDERCFDYLGYLKKEVWKHETY